MDLNIRRSYTVVEDRWELAGQRVDVPVRKIAAVIVLENPFVDRYVDDLDPLVSASVELGKRMAQMALDALGSYSVQGYGKGGLVGLRGEAEHASALLTTAFANPIRDAIGGGRAWISSMVKMAAPGSVIDIPMNHIDDVYVRSHYDGMTLCLQDTPMPDEIGIIFCMTSGARLNARVGGLTHHDVMARRT
ncbi:amino acid synthesis family protein [Rhodopseudomonas palustris]|uniref:Amino acid synthesis family protein n=1 Tax=Rhodopseudomonas palustris TaxID=1076 RepID=A0A418VRD7_RHOPL|nr:amino acid synthesis family protein [Rhodopseudomonas palustris]RJF78913.1 amino acid synthesis family protein [Rhodopseudomonas palustris]